MLDFAAGRDGDLDHQLAVGDGLADGRNVAELGPLDGAEIGRARFRKGDLDGVALPGDGVINRAARPVEHQPVAVGMDARTTIGPDGVGIATSVVHDVEGPVGTTAQALFVRER